MPVKKFYTIFFSFLFVSLLSGCATDRAFVKEDEELQKPMNEWVEQSLIPYLQKELGQHPRFKNQPIQLVGFEGEQISETIDVLSDDVRSKLFDSLLKTSGVNLVWRPSNFSLGQGQIKVSSANCAYRQQPRYYVGLDLKHLNNRYARVAVRALDLSEESWVSGFGKVWKGELTAQQFELSQTVRSDEYLRGLRQLPFKESQVDLIAEGLAKNLACLMQSFDKDKFSIYIKADSSKNMTDRVSTLLGRYLSEYQDVVIVNNAKKAEFQIETKLIDVSGNLKQIWAAMKLISKDELLSGTDTSVYVEFNGQMHSEEMHFSVQPPIEESFDAVKPNASSASVNLLSTTTSVIDEVTLLTPISPSMCNVSNPWMFGSLKLETGAVVTEKSCALLELKMKKSAQVVVLHEDSFDDFQRIWPTSCTGDKRLSATLEARAKQTVPDIEKYPEARIRFNKNKGEEVFHVLATDDHKTTEQLKELMSMIPDGCEKIPMKKPSFDIHEQLHSIKRMGLLDWKIQQLDHQ